MFLYAYVDIIALYKPGVLDSITNGFVWTFEVSPTLLTILLASVSIPALMVVLSMALPTRVNRDVNLVVASLFIPFTLFNAVGESWDWAAFTPSPSESSSCSWPSSSALPGPGQPPGPRRRHPAKRLARPEGSQKRVRPSCHSDPRLPSGTNPNRSTTMRKTSGHTKASNKPGAQQ